MTRRGADQPAWAEIRRQVQRRAASIPAWVPDLDPRTLQRRLFTGGFALFAISMVFSYGILTLTGAVSRLDIEPAAESEVLASSVVPTPAPEPQPEIVPVVTPPEDAVVPTSQKPSDADQPATTLRVITGRVPGDGTVAGALAEQGVTSRLVHQISTALRPIFQFRHAHEGDFFALIQDSRGRLLSFEFQRGRRDIYRLERKPDGDLVRSHSQVPLERRVAQLAGIVERSLFESVVELGEGSDLVNEFADIFVWDFDFGRQTRPGDEFRMVFEKFYDKEGFVRYGAVLAAQYRTQNKDYTAVYFEDSDGYGDYFTPEGNSVRRTFLRAPLRYSRISSRYTNSRLHPILKVRRPHRGVDYAAPMGTPVWAVADGEVIFRGWGGGFGRLMKVRHRNGYVSYYGHLSQYADGLDVGSRVGQKQVIGYVGSSGLSSGPHLDYRLKLAGNFVDPMRVKFPKGEPIPVKARDQFDEIKKARLSALDQASPALVLEAAM